MSTVLSSRTETILSGVVVLAIAAFLATQIEGSFEFTIWAFKQANEFSPGMTPLQRGAHFVFYFVGGLLGVGITTTLAGAAITFPIIGLVCLLNGVSQ